MRSTAPRATRRTVRMGGRSVLDRRAPNLPREAEVRDWLNQVQEPWDDLHMHVEEIAEASDGRLFVGLGLSARGKESGVETHLRFWTVSWIVDGKIARRRSFRERAEALEAAGISEQPFGGG